MEYLQEPFVPVLLLYFPSSSVWCYSYINTFTIIDYNYANPHIEVILPLDSFRSMVPLNLPGKYTVSMCISFSIQILYVNGLLHPSSNVPK